MVQYDSSGRQLVNAEGTGEMDPRVDLGGFAFQPATKPTLELADVVALCVAADVGKFETFEKPPTSSGLMGGTDYQVPAGKTLYITHVIFAGDTIGSCFAVGYGDDGVSASASAPTNAVALMAQYSVMAVAADTSYAFNVFLTVPAGKYPYVVAANGKCRVTAFGVVA